MKGQLGCSRCSSQRSENAVLCVDVVVALNQVKVASVPLKKASMALLGN